MLNYIILGITYGFIAGVQPGPLQTYIISQTIRRGWKSTLPAAFAPIISDIPIFMLIIFLLTTIPENFIIALRILGGLFLIYLSYSTYKSWKNFDAEEKLKEPNIQQSLLNAVVVNILNPNPYLGWSLVLGPLFIEAWNAAPSQGISLIISFYLSIIFFLAITIIVFAFTRKLGPKISKILFGLSVLVLLGFGIFQLWIGIGLIL